MTERVPYPGSFPDADFYTCEEPDAEDRSGRSTVLDAIWCRLSEHGPGDGCTVWCCTIVGEPDEDGLCDTRVTEVELTGEQLVELCRVEFPELLEDQ